CYYCYHCYTFHHPLLSFPTRRSSDLCLAVKPTFSISFVRIAFWAFTIFGLSGTTEPSKYFFKVATPLLIHNNVGSSFGTSETLGSIVCPFYLKNCNNYDLVSSEVSCFM